MEWISAVQAARHLGVAERTVRNMVNRGELEVLSVDPVRFDPRHVAAVLAARQESALLELALLRKDPLQLARETREFLHRPPGGLSLPHHRAEDQKRRMGLVSAEAKTLFGTAALTAAQSDDDACRWCKAQEFTRLLGGWAPTTYGEAFRELFGQSPCERCGPRLYGPVLAALRARVHPAGDGPPAGRSEPAAPQMRAEARPPARREPAPAQPVQDGDADVRAWVSKRRRQVQARITEAKRSGDRQYEGQLRLQLQSLTADAASLDGRAANTRRGQR
ncbi:helix-turn-helix domain-containing protein [Streptomyces chartreusis]|uniref:helix-turn-helix domain-containing protein n=1 Tax=Streptomyces chartreusis TaxID=1969 RepID=UPI003644FE38